MNGLPRLIGEREGQFHGPLLIVVGQVHGNEIAGPKAIETAFQLLEAEFVEYPNFSFKGKIVGLRGNTRAAALGQRFLNRDMNRMWVDGIIRDIQAKPAEAREAEELEIMECLDAIVSLQQAYQPTETVILDIHTTTATGGIFSIPSFDPEAEAIALHFHAPIVHGMLNGLQGTMMHYFNRERFAETTTLAFEAGQHLEEDSWRNALSAIINCMRAIGMVDVKDVETKHDQLLQARAAHLPKVTRLVYRHAIQAADAFVMRPGYINFQKIAAGEHLADDRNGKVLSPCDGLMLMPLYQKLGEDGFFILAEV
jgi:succinylglutamate desuccinylase